MLGYGTGIRIIFNDKNAIDKFHDPSKAGIVRRTVLLCITRILITSTGASATKGTYLLKAVNSDGSISTCELQVFNAIKPFLGT